MSDAPPQPLLGYSDDSPRQPDHIKRARMDEGPVLPTSHVSASMPAVQDPRPAPDDEPILQFFEFAHLREDLRAVSAPFGDLARWIVATLPRNPERTVALRKLLETKDAAVRAAVYRGR